MKIEAMVEFAKRNEKIFDLWQNGSTYRSIAQSFGISQQKVSEICIRMKQRVNWPEFRKLIPVGAQTPLLSAVGNDETIFEHPERIAALNPKELLRVKSMGKTKLAYISAALALYGYAFKSSILERQPVPLTPRLSRSSPGLFLS